MRARRQLARLVGRDCLGKLDPSNGRVCNVVTRRKQLRKQRRGSVCSNVASRESAAHVIPMDAVAAEESGTELRSQILQSPLGSLRMTVTEDLCGTCER
jgi:hypothetical protein